jgi:hypothetical protein
VVQLPEGAIDALQFRDDFVDERGRSGSFASSAPIPAWAASISLPVSLARRRRGPAILALLPPLLHPLLGAADPSEGLERRRHVLRVQLATVWQQDEFGGRRRPLLDLIRQAHAAP